MGLSQCTPCYLWLCTQPALLSGVSNSWLTEDDNGRVSHALGRCWQSEREKVLVFTFFENRAEALPGPPV